MSNTNKMPFWKTKSLSEMNTKEWESLCDGCARCCLHKLEDEDTGDVYYTNIACRYLDLETCHCRSYSERNQLVDDCILLEPEKTDAFGWLPDTCAYKRIAKGKELPSWHPLVSGNPDSVYSAGASIQSFAITETPDTNPEEHLTPLPEAPKD